MGILIIIIFPILIIFVVLMTCKFFNFSILPDDLKLPAPQKFVMPKIKRNKYNYTWESYESEDDESYDSDDDFSL